jgi:hypothetical protein
LGELEVLWSQPGDHFPRDLDLQFDKFTISGEVIEYMLRKVQNNPLQPSLIMYMKHKKPVKYGITPLLSFPLRVSVNFIHSALSSRISLIFVSVKSQKLLFFTVFSTRSGALITFKNRFFEKNNITLDN